MTRVRGFADWRPQARTRALLGQVQAVLEEYASYLPLTCRQIFYRLVGAHGYAKTERAYESLQNMLVRARRAGIVAFEDIRDDGVTAAVPWGYNSETDFWAARLGGAWSFRFHWQDGQPRFVEVWVEAAGMVPLVAGAVGDHGVPVYSCGGFDSLTFKHEAAARVASRDVPTVVLHVGDHDPSGVALFHAASEDVEEMAEGLGGEVGFRRIAVTAAQVERYGLPTAPPKETDRRGAWQGGSTVQVEAFPPDVLVTEVLQAIEQEFDDDTYRALVDRERRTRERIGATMRELQQRLRERQP